MAKGIRSNRLRQGGARKALIPAMDENIEKFGKRVTPLPSGCWAFDGDVDDYHAFGGRYAHTWLWRYLHGPSEGYHIHHLCENKGCVNPQHLKRLTPYEHMVAHDELNALRDR